MTENPYESPRGMSDEPREEMSEYIELPPQQIRERWKFILLGVSLLLGLISYVPWLAVIFAIFSAPVFLRSHLRARRAASSGNLWRLKTHGTGVAGTIGLAVSILAASAGAFLGTCTATLWLIVPPIYVSMRGDMPSEWLLICGGVAVGTLAFLTTTAWLFRRLF